MKITIPRENFITIKKAANILSDRGRVSVPNLFSIKKSQTTIPYLKSHEKPTKLTKISSVIKKKVPLPFHIPSFSQSPTTLIKISSLFSHLKSWSKKPKKSSSCQKRARTQRQGDKMYRNYPRALEEDWLFCLRLWCRCGETCRAIPEARDANSTWQRALPRCLCPHHRRKFVQSFSSSLVTMTPWRKLWASRWSWPSVARNCTDFSSFPQWCSRALRHRTQSSLRLPELAHTHCEFHYLHRIAHLTRHSH